MTDCKLFLYILPFLSINDFKHYWNLFQKFFENIFILVIFEKLKVYNLIQ